MKAVKMGWEWNWPRLMPFGDGVWWFDAELRTSHAGDHSPGIWLLLIVFNLKLIDCGFYNALHDDHEEEEG